MNVNRIDESQKRLNYYCRSSPKKKKNHYYACSPLLIPTHNPNPRPNHSHRSIRSQPVSLHSSFKIDTHEAALSSSYNQILIEQSSDEQILIDDPCSQDLQSNARVLLISDPQRHIQAKQEQPQQGAYSLPKKTKINDIRIQDDQNNQADTENTIHKMLAKQPNQTAQDGFIRIENQQLVVSESKSNSGGQQTMNRQFTFGQEFLDSQKAYLQALPLPMTKEVPEEQSEKNNSPQSSSEQFAETQFDQFHEDVPFFESNMEYSHLESTQKRPELDLDLIEASSNFDELFNTEDYQSPTFNAISLRKIEDKWITAEDNQLMSPKKKASNEILIESSRPSNMTSRAISLSMRPFGNSVYLLNEILHQIPQELSKVYNEMHKKLILDQINAEQSFERQEEKIKILKMLLSLRRQSLKCEQYLLSPSNHQDETIEMNKVIIHSLIKQFMAK